MFPELIFHEIKKNVIKSLNNALKCFQGFYILLLNICIHFNLFYIYIFLRPSNPLPSHHTMIQLSFKINNFKVIRRLMIIFQNFMDLNSYMYHLLEIRNDEK